MSNDKKKGMSKRQVKFVSTVLDKKKRDKMNKLDARKAELRRKGMNEDEARRRAEFDMRVAEREKNRVRNMADQMRRNKSNKK